MSGKEDSDKKSGLEELRTAMQRREAVRWRDEYPMLLVTYAENDPDFRATVVQVAEFFGCTTRAVYKWKDEHPEFAEAFEAAKQIVVDRSLAGLYELAVGATSRSKKVTRRPDGTETEEITIRRDAPNVHAAIFLLKNLRPNEWKDRRDLDLVTGGDPIKPIIVFSEPKAGPEVIDVVPETVEDVDE